MGGKQPQCGRVVGMKDFGVAPDSLMLQSLLQADLPGLDFFSLLSLFFLPVRMQAHTLCLDSSFPAAKLKSYLPLKALGRS